MLKNLLQGKPFGHPIHPLLVHLPIGLFALSLVLDFGSLLFGSAALIQGAFYTLIFGVALALFAALFGVVDWMDIRLDHPAKKVANTHLILNLLAVGVYAVSLAFRWNDLNDTATDIFPLLLSLLAFGFIGVSGYLGGTLVYSDGIAVGRHRRKEDTPSETANILADELSHGYVRVAGAADLQQGETMRLNINDQVLTLVKDAGQIYAIEEFCTHMYGPLSDGRINDCTVECPWHRSKFDLKTGKVVQGPAEKPIKVFETIVREDDVYVHLPQPEGHKKPERVKA